MTEEAQTKMAEMPKARSEDEDSERYLRGYGKGAPNVTATERDLPPGRVETDGSGGRTRQGANKGQPQATV